MQRWATLFWELYTSNNIGLMLLWNVDKQFEKHNVTQIKWS